MLNGLPSIDSGEANSLLLALSRDHCPCRKNPSGRHVAGRSHEVCFSPCVTVEIYIHPPHAAIVAFLCGRCRVPVSDRDRVEFCSAQLSSCQCPRALNLGVGRHAIDALSSFPRRFSFRGSRRVDLSVEAKLGHVACACCCLSHGARRFPSMEYGVLATI
ncbi:hypothetical protein VTN77DRAFT_3709 [Rasamsonia byssochlamydoides]|uniref:uncharacterized protein n=1 Tax=Rasamsonia byssochlamydoides TaxID=89139 RepID=UPI00374357A6